jgi:FkbM family methyltransferase
MQKLPSRFYHYLKIGPEEFFRSRRDERAWYPSAGAWLTRVYDRILRRAPRLPLPGRKAIRALRFKDMHRPFFVRLGSSDLQLHQTIRFRGEYDPVIQETSLDDIRQVVDLGSNAGYTIRLWRELFPKARIIGVEPDPDNIRICRANADSLPGGRVDLIQACVDGKSGSVWLDRSKPEHQYKIGQTVQTNSLEVEAITVPEVLARTRADPVIDFLKCDVQGAEQAIFADCASWIHRVRNMIVEVHPPYTGDQLIADLQKAGWTWRRHTAHKTDNLWVLFFWVNDAKTSAPS